MTDLTNYSDRMREMMADPAIRREALIELSLDKDGNATEAIFELMHHQYSGVEKLNKVMVDILQAMIDKERLFNGEQATDALEGDE